MSYLAVPTIAIECDDVPSGFVRINLADFDASEHVKYLTPEEKAAQTVESAKK